MAAEHQDCQSCANEGTLLCHRWELRCALSGEASDAAVSLAVAWTDVQSVFLRARIEKSCNSLIRCSITGALLDLRGPGTQPLRQDRVVDPRKAVPGRGLV